MFDNVPNGPGYRRVGKLEAFYLTLSAADAAKLNSVIDDYRIPVSAVVRMLRIDAGFIIGASAIQRHRTARYDAQLHAAKAARAAARREQTARQAPAAITSRLS